jgi:hypothetical protein
MRQDVTPKAVGGPWFLSSRIVIVSFVFGRSMHYIDIYDGVSTSYLATEVDMSGTVRLEMYHARIVRQIQAITVQLHNVHTS